MPMLRKIVPCLWFDNQAEDAAKFYVSTFGKNSRITQVTHYTEAGKETHGRKAGSVMTVAFELAGDPLTALNGGPHFKFNEAVSLQVMCDDDQAEVDHFWNALGAGGDERAQQCGWLKDKYGLSWQIVPRMMDDMFTDEDPVRAGRVMTAMLKMKKLDVAALKAAARG
jgi:predicted 3-demethylubiquinone-9 3-methyltransferase (glyoxalase superfamily)